MASAERIAQLEAIRRRRIDLDYNTLRNDAPDRLRQCVEAATGIGFRHHRALAAISDQERLALLADIESALVAMVLEVRYG